MQYNINGKIVNEEEALKHYYDELKDLRYNFSNLDLNIRYQIKDKGYDTTPVDYKYKRSFKKFEKANFKASKIIDKQKNNPEIILLLDKHLNDWKKCFESIKEKWLQGKSSDKDFIDNTYHILGMCACVEVCILSAMEKVQSLTNQNVK